MPASDFGVTPASNIQASAQLGYISLFANSGNAINIGTLTENASSLNVSARLEENVPKDYYNFNFNSGSAIKLDFTNMTQTTTVRVQLFDIVGNVVADNQGTDDQKAAYASLNSASGLNAANGTYYIKVSYADGAPKYGQDYNFQLYSGTTYDSTLITSALMQPYDPNLFVSVSSSVVSSSKIKVYTRNATHAATASVANSTSLGTVKTNDTALNAIGTLTGKNPVEDYNFSVAQSSKVKLNFANVTNSTLLHVRLLDSAGKVVADNQGSSDQQLAYLQLTSAAGYNAKKGTYVVQVSYANGAIPSDEKYNFQIYSGNSYTNFYTTTAANPSAAPKQQYQLGANLGVFSDVKAKEGSRQAYNVINATVYDAVNIGWLKADTSSLNLVSQLTKDDRTAYYSFTFQQGSSIKMAYRNTTDRSAQHIQIMDPTGTHIFADNMGTKAQKAAFAKLTSDEGMAAKPGSDYIIKVEYDPNASKTKTITYDLQLYSGSQFTQQYKTVASAQTAQNYLLSGGTFGYTKNGLATGLFNSDSTSILSLIRGTNT